MQNNNLVNKMRTLKMLEGYKGTQVYPVNPSAGGGGGGSIGEKFLERIGDHLRVNSIRSRTTQNIQADNTVILAEALALYGLPQLDLIEPQIEACLKSVNFIETLADVYRRLENCSQFEKSGVYLEQCALLRGLPDPKMFRRSLLLARQHAVDVHLKIVLSAALRYARRDDELLGTSSMDCCGRFIECPKAALMPGYNPESVNDSCNCLSARKVDKKSDVEFLMEDDEECSTSEEDCDMSFWIGEEEVRCNRYSISSLSRPFKAMLYGSFMEAKREKINFTHNGISVKGMKGVEVFSRTKSLDSFDLDVVLELLSLANKFCCDEMKSACDAYLAKVVFDMDTAMLLIEYGLEETAYLLVAACLQVILRELPSSLNSPNVLKLFCSSEARERLALAGHASFALYNFLRQVSMDDDLKANTTVMLLERLAECSTEDWQKQLSFHMLGCVMLERKEYKDAQKWFKAAVEAGHIYSFVGIARTKHKRGHTYSAYKLMNALISDYTPSGWMYQERSLYCNGKEKMMDLNTATELDPTLSYPYKYRAILMLEENRAAAAITEIEKIIGFKVSTDCLELRAWLLLSQEDYDGALRDVRAIMTLDPNYMMFHGKLHGEQLVELLGPHVQQWSQADCWIQLYDRWSAVDDIGSLAVVHHMLANDPGKSLLLFRQSLLLLR